MTLRTRLILFVLALAVTLVVGLGLYVGSSLRAWSRDALDSELELQAYAIARAVKLDHGEVEIEDDELGPAARLWPYRVQSPNGQVLLEAGRFEWPPLPDGHFEEPRIQSISTDGGGRTRVLNLEFEPEHGHGQRWVLRVAAPEGTFGALVQRFRNGLMVAVGLAALASVIGAALLAQLFLGPLNRLSREVAGIEATALDRRLTMRGLDPELGRLASAFNGVLERLQRAFELQRGFVARASHSLRTPVASILSTAEVALRRDRPAPEYRAALEEIAQSARGAATLAEGLLALSRVEQRATSLEATRLDVSELLEELRRLFRVQAEQAGVELEVATEPSLTVTANRSALREMLDALVDNAIRYTPAGGTVRLEGRARGDSVTLGVLDTGLGIRPEEREKVFERFYRGSAAEELQRAGSGLGLSLVRALAEVERIELTLGDAPGGGACVTLRLPVS